MKKSVFTLLAIATAVVTMSSCSQNDGGSSNDLNLTQTTNNTPSVASNNGEGTVSTVVTADCFDFFDINVVRTAGTDTKTLSLTESSTEGDVKVKKVDDKFTTTSDAAFSVKATVTPKANWKEVAASKGDATLVFGGNTSFDIPGHYDGGHLSNLKFKANELNDETMQNIVKALLVRIEASK